VRSIFTQICGRRCHRAWCQTRSPREINAPT
jgi:hypothetical protein